MTGLWFSSRNKSEAFAESGRGEEEGKKKEKIT